MRILFLVTFKKMMQLTSYIIQHTQLSEKAINNSISLLNEDCTIPFIARYRKEITGNLDEVHELVSGWDTDKIINAYLEAPKKGFNTELMGKDLLYWSSILLGISKKGLKTRDVLSKSRESEVKFLNHLDKLIDNKTTNADHMINKFSKNENLNDLYDK